MKRVFFLVLLTFISLVSVAQKVKKNNSKVGPMTCDLNEQYNRCMQSLRPLGFRFLKSYKLEGDSSKPMEYQYTFSKGTTYLISIQPSDPNANLKVSLYDQDGKMIASSYNAKNKKFYPSIEILCQRTGIYKISFSHESKQAYCAASIIGFKR
ncbi:MAG: hypothetical protein OHK0045_15140 [Raineya sp.]